MQQARQAALASGPLQVGAFIDRWSRSEANERANYTLFLTELCGLLGVPTPNPSTGEDRNNSYVFERSVPLVHEGGRTTTGRIDLYKRNCFVLEAKQGSTHTVSAPLFGIDPGPTRVGHGRRGTPAWDDAMQRAKNQAERYARSLPPEEGRPPFILVVDVGHTIEIYSEFSRTGGTYVPFPDPPRHRIYLEDLAENEIQELLRAIWTNPESLDPSLKSARVTRAIAARLAQLAKTLEADGHEPEVVASFLMRIIFTMFAEDVGLLPPYGLKGLLEGLRGNTEHFLDHIQPLWETMNEGGYSRDLRETVLRFNGKLFADPTALPINEEQLELLIQAAHADWRDVEPAIFGTLLERALDPRERHKLGAHYTPRAYVERLVQPTIIEPLREEWHGVQAAARQHLSKGKTQEAATELKRFHERLTSLHILDPAAGSANFLYVSMELLKRLEGEVLAMLEGVSGQDPARLEMHRATVSPEQFLGLEINPRAATVARLVLWIGYLQWHFRTRGDTMPPEPVIQSSDNIQHRDALIEYDAIEPVLDENGEPVTRWDGVTVKTHSVTGRQVPDETARVAEVRYVNPRKAVWPQAEKVISNPPFLGAAQMRQALGNGYTEAVRAAYPEVPESVDFVMYWWHKAAELLRAAKRENPDKLESSNKLERFGYITTNSIRQTFNRRVLDQHMNVEKPVSLIYAIPDHPWVDAADGAAVRISMTVAEGGEHAGLLRRVIEETPGDGDAYDLVFSTMRGKIFSNLTIGADVGSAVSLKANEGISNPGVKLHGAGFIVTPEEAQELGLGSTPGLEHHIRDYRNGRDLTQISRGVKVIDLFGLTAEDVRSRFPAVYQHVYEHVKPERDQNNRKPYREDWWIFGEPRATLRPALADLKRYIATVETSKHRFFAFMDQSILPDNMLVNIALDDGYSLGVLSSRVHVAWALGAGGTLEDRPRYNKTRCFETFPFPDATPEQQERISNIAEQLDAHRKTQLAAHPKLTITGIYNILEKLKSGEPLNAHERTVHSQGLVGILKELHDQLDAEVLAAYGWEDHISDEEILARLVALNAGRAAEETTGIVRWLRPEYQVKDGTSIQVSAGMKTPTPTRPAAKTPWPDTLPEQARALRALVTATATPLDSTDAARLFTGARRDRVQEILDTLADLGQLVKLEDGRYAP